jgi:hypothetical protein
MAIAGSVESREETLRTLRKIERKALWLSTWLIHNVNHEWQNLDGH